ncbi:MAG: imidazole glycerol phosphate synthase subunit HisH [Clostridia bacterium]|nr:MAG: imidazole glycerol phosphate synthase subunit HisH [Clostridia bacterium]
MIAIVDYGMGNLRSVQKGLEKVGFAAEVTADPERVLAARGVVLPGVGAFAAAMKALRDQGLVPALKETVAAGKPFLGICLGLQLLFTGSEEGGWHEGLGIFPGRVKKLPAGLKIPHMGWNEVTWQGASPLTEGMPAKGSFYFVHSYYVEPEDSQVVLGLTDYGIAFVSAVRQNLVFGLQCHPEKSSRLGLELLRNFGELVYHAGDPGH